MRVLNMDVHESSSASWFQSTEIEVFRNEQRAAFFFSREEELANFLPQQY